jgi:hypothetical protein
MPQILNIGVDVLSKRISSKPPVAQLLLRRASKRRCTRVVCRLDFQDKKRVDATDENFGRVDQEE